MTYGQSVIYGLISVGIMYAIYFAIVKPMVTVANERYEKKEALKEESFTVYEKYTKIKEYVEKEVLTEDFTNVETLITVVKRLKEYRNWLLSPESFAISRLERAKLNKRIKDLILRAEMAYGGITV